MLVRQTKKMSEFAEFVHMTDAELARELRRQTLARSRSRLKVIKARGTKAKTLFKIWGEMVVGSEREFRCKACMKYENNAVKRKLTQKGDYTVFLYHFARCDGIGHIDWINELDKVEKYNKQIIIEIV